jgi:1,2-diacylglycerol 3-alpha-glucosyltransferase
MNKNIFSKVGGYLLRTIKSIKIVREKEYDYAISSSPFFFDIIPLYFCKSKNKIANIFHIVPKRKAISLQTFFRFKIARIEQKISYWLIKKCANIIWTGNIVEKEKIAEIFPEKKIVIADAGIDIKRSDKIANIKKENDLACFAGRLTSQKGIFDLVKIIKGIVQTNKNFQILIIGDGPDKNKLQEEIRKNRLEKNIILKGFVSEEEKYKIFKKSRYFFFPSYEEGWGIVLAEALYNECLCFTYELPYYKHLFKNFPVYIKKGDTKEFIEKFLENKNKKISLEQKEFIKKYDYKNCIKKLENETFR